MCTRTGGGPVTRNTADQTPVRVRQRNLASGAVSFQQLAGPGTVCLTLWDSEAAATEAAPADPVICQPAGLYEVAATARGRAAGTAPTHVRLMYFDGPRGPEQVAAEQRAGLERIWPAITHFDGLVGVYVLRGHDRGSIVITLATSVEALDASGRAAMATRLLPGEDPALLGGPDGIEIHHVTSYQMPATEPAASMEELRS